MGVEPPRFVPTMFEGKVPGKDENSAHLTEIETTRQQDTMSKQLVLRFLLRRRMKKEEEKK